MLKVAIVGCGKIADSHASQIQKIPDCEIVGVCDKEELMARQLFDRFPVKQYFTDFDRLLDEAKPDVVHITTPPQSHFKIGKQCLEKGCHIYVEKPFTVDTSEAEELIAVANRLDRKVTVGHDAQFSIVSRRMRKLVREGYLGGAPVHLESYWCYELGDPVYAKALLGDKHHWARTLPGGLLHNIISHGISKIAEFIEDDNPQVIADGFVSPFLRGLGEEKIVDELRAIIRGQEGTTAFFTFSTQMQPSLHQFRLYGPKNGLLLDEDERVLIKLDGRRYKSYAQHFLPAATMASRYLGNLGRNLRLFLKMEFHMESGIRNLIEAFYRSIRNGDVVPIPYREILLTSRVMDAIFEQIAKRHAQLEADQSK